MDDRLARPARFRTSGMMCLYALTFLIPLGLYAFDSQGVRFLKLSWIIWCMAIYVISRYISRSLFSHFASYFQYRLLTMIYEFCTWLFMFIIMLYPGLWMWHFWFPLQKHL